MHIVIFCQSIVSDWNHGNAHFLRGITSELLELGHSVRILEPENGWSIVNLVEDEGEGAVVQFHQAFPRLESEPYNPATIDLDEATAAADLVLVHEWIAPELVRRIGECRTRAKFKLLFHDTHHRSVTDPDAMRQYDLRNYDGVLAFGESVREQYLRQGWARQVWTWHEAADTRVFRPVARREREGDLVWIGNWGDDERTAELREFLVEPVRALGLRAKVHGVRYPERALEELAGAGIEYCGWVANYEVPEVFSRFDLTVHVPRRPYASSLAGIPTIRIFEALACGIPLVSAPWEDSEGLFAPGLDFLVARNGAEMKRDLQTLMRDEEMRQEIAAHGLATIRARHTCAHRVDELMRIASHMGAVTQDAPEPAVARTGA